MQLRRLWPVCILVLALTPGAAGAKDEPMTLTVAGQGGTAATLLVRRTTTLHFALHRGGLSVTGGTTYAGLAVHDAEGALVAAAVRPKQFVSDGKASLVPVGPGRDAVELQPGRYRMTLLGDGSVRAVVEATGLPAPARLAARERVPGIDAGVVTYQTSAGTESGSRQVRVTGPSTVAILTFSRSSSPSHEREWYCIRPAPASCSAVDNDFTGSSSAVFVGRSTSTSALSTTVSQPGTYLVGSGAARVSVDSDHAGFAISLPGHPERP